MNDVHISFHVQQRSLDEISGLHTMACQRRPTQKTRIRVHKFGAFRKEKILGSL